MTKLAEAQLVEIRRMSEAGMTLIDIGLILGFARERFEQLQTEDPRVLAAYEAGRADGLRAAGNALLQSTTAGDVSAARLLLRRLEDRDQEEAEAVDAKAQIRFAEQAAEVIPRIAAALQRQRTLRADLLRDSLPEGLSDTELEALWQQGRVARVEDMAGNVLGYRAFARER